MFFSNKKTIKKLKEKLALAEQALSYWVSYNAESRDIHPCPDLALRAFYRKKAMELSEKLEIRIL